MGDDVEMTDLSTPDNDDDDFFHGNLHHLLGHHLHFGHHTHVSHLTHHSNFEKRQYLACKRKLPLIKRRCHVKLQRLRRTYHKYTVKVRKARHAVKYWVKKYHWCHKFCWWRYSHSGKKGEEEYVACLTPFSFERIKRSPPALTANS